MAELDLTAIANTSIATPSSGVGAVFIDTDKKLKIKNDAGTVQTLMNMSAQTIATAAGTTALTNTSPVTTVFTGSTTQTVTLPSATTIQAGQEYQIRNNSSGLVTIQDGNAGALIVLSAGTSAYFMLITAGTTAGVWDVDQLGFFADPTDTTKKIVSTNSGATTGTILTLAGQQATSQTLSYPIIRQAETLAVKPQVATTLSTPLNPTGTTSTAGVMMGLAQAITPQVTGRILVTVCGVVAQSTTADGATWQIRVGTGSAPANAAALTGTAYGSLQSMTFTGVLKVPFSLTALVTGLTVGTAAWVDVSLAAVTAGTATMTSVACSVTEL
jgi:hypothetical protein